MKFSEKPTCQKFFGILLLSFILIAGGCSHEDPVVRNENDILGAWDKGDGTYLRFEKDNIVMLLNVTEQDNLTIGDWSRDVYFYEPGYELLIYMDAELQPNVYQVIKLTDRELVICWVDNLRDEYGSDQSIGEIIGNIIKDAHEGYDLNPAYFTYYTKISDDEYYDIIQNIDVMEPWWDDWDMILN